LVCTSLSFFPFAHLFCFLNSTYYSAIKKNEISPCAMIWMELESIMLSEISQSEKDKYHDLTHMWNVRNKTNEHRVGKRGKP